MALPSFVRRFSALPVAWVAVRPAWPSIVALASIFIVTKLLKLPVGWPKGLYAADLYASAGQFLEHIVLHSSLALLLVLMVLLGGLIWLFMRRRQARWIAWVAPLPLIYLGTVAAGFLNDDPKLWRSLFFYMAGMDLLELVALWWRDAVVITLLFGLLVFCFTRDYRRPSKLNIAVALTAVMFAFLVASLDLAFFLVTRSQLTTEELFYAITSPGDAALASRDVSTTGCWIALAMCALLCAISIYLMLRWRRRSMNSTAPERHWRFGLALWPAMAVAVAAPASPRLINFVQTADNTVFRVATEVIARPIARLSAPRLLEGTGRIPTIDGAPVFLEPTARSERLNVVIVMLESMRADATSFVSQDLDTTPFLTEFAQESLVVDEMYAIVPRTSAAWIAVLGGRYPAAMSTMRRWSGRNPAPPISSSLARLLGSQGYVSGFFVPTTLDYENEQAIVDSLGFDHVTSGESLDVRGQNRINSFGWDDRLLLDPIGMWLDARASDRKPFLLAIMTNATHYPYGLPKGIERREYANYHPAQASYLNTVRYLDTYLRDLVDGLRTRGLLENSLVILVGDHGEAFFEHDSFLHGMDVYEEELRVPMLLRFPESAQRRGHVSGVRQQIDILPTVAGALGFELRGGKLPGRSLLENSHGHERLFFGVHFERTLIAMRDGRFKFHYSFGRKPTAVFDLAADPGEHHDLHSKIEPAVLRQAEADLITWDQQVRRSYLEETR